MWRIDWVTHYILYRFYIYISLHHITRYDGNSEKLGTRIKQGQVIKVYYLEWITFVQFALVIKTTLHTGYFEIIDLTVILQLPTLILLSCKYNCQENNPVFSIIGFSTMNHILIFIDSISGATWHFNYCHKLFSEVDATRSTSNGTSILGELYTSCTHVCMSLNQQSLPLHYILCRQVSYLVGFLKWRMRSQVPKMSDIVSVYCKRVQLILRWLECNNSEFCNYYCFIKFNCLLRVCNMFS